MDGLSRSVSPLRQYPRRTERTLAQWNSEWPIAIGNDEINIDPENAYVSNLDGRGFGLVVHCGPSFPLSPPLPVFSHVHLHHHTALRPLHQHQKLHDWLTSQRLELLIHNRRSVALAQFITWNGYGESLRGQNTWGAARVAEVGGWVRPYRCVPPAPPCLGVRDSILVGARLVGYDRISYQGVHWQDWNVPGY